MQILYRIDAVDNDRLSSIHFNLSCNLYSTTVDHYQPSTILVETFCNFFDSLSSWNAAMRPVFLTLRFIDIASIFKTWLLAFKLNREHPLLSRNSFPKNLISNCCTLL